MGTGVEGPLVNEELSFTLPRPPTTCRATDPHRNPKGVPGGEAGAIPDGHISPGLFVGTGASGGRDPPDSDHSR